MKGERKNDKVLIIYFFVKKRKDMTTTVAIIILASEIYCKYLVKMYRIGYSSV